MKKYGKTSLKGLIVCIIAKHQNIQLILLQGNKKRPSKLRVTAPNKEQKYELGSLYHNLN